jgi:hypothetical protein
MMLAYASGKEINVMPDETAEVTAVEWEDLTKVGAEDNHFA